MNLMASPERELERKLELQIDAIEAEIMASVVTRLRFDRLVEETDTSDFFPGSLGSPNAELAEYANKLLAEEVAKYNQRASRLKQPVLPNPKISQRRMFDRLFRMGKLQPLLDDPDVEEIEINRPDQVFAIKAGKGKFLTKVRFRDNEEVLMLVKRLAASGGRHLDEASPILDVQLPGGERLNAVIPPIARNVVVTIRKHSHVISNLEELVERNTLSLAAATFLSACVSARLNLLICGGTATGKTTFLNALGSKVSRTDRVVVIEEVAELQIERVVEDTVCLQSRPANIEGQGEINLWSLVKNSLRMRPVWIVVGEVRGTEALEMLLAITSGHSGMCTLHADSPYAALDRLVTLAGMSKESPDEERLNSLIAGGIRIVVHLKNDFSTGERKVTSIMEVTGRDGSKVLGNEIFKLTEDGEGGEKLAWTGTLPRCIHELEVVGLDWEKHISSSNRVVSGRRAS
jgi:pilus assembly protein CpaF